MKDCRQELLNNYIWYALAVLAGGMLLRRNLMSVGCLVLVVLLTRIWKLGRAGCLTAMAVHAFTPVFWGNGLKGVTLVSIPALWRTAAGQSLQGPYARASYSLAKRIFTPGVTNMWQLPEYAAEREHNLWAALLKTEANLPGRILPWEPERGFVLTLNVLFLWIGFGLTLAAVFGGLYLCLKNRKRLRFLLCVTGMLIPVVVFIKSPFTTVADTRLYLWIPMLKALLLGMCADRLYEDGAVLFRGNREERQSGTIQEMENEGKANG